MSRKLGGYKYHDCVCASQLAKQYGVHRATVARRVRDMLEVISVESGVVKLGWEYLFTPKGVDDFEEFVLSGPGSRLKTIIVERREKGIKVEAIATRDIPHAPRTAYGLQKKDRAGRLDMNCAAIAKSLGVSGAGMVKWFRAFLESDGEVPPTIAFGVGNAVYFTPIGQKALFKYIITNTGSRTPIHSAVAKKLKTTKPGT